jgi:hypothetical protein
VAWGVTRNSTNELYSGPLLFQVGIGNQVGYNRVVEQVIEQGLRRDGDELRNSGDGSFTNDRPRVRQQRWENFEWLWGESRVREIIREPTDQDRENGKGFDKGLWWCVGLLKLVSSNSVTTRKRSPTFSTWPSSFGVNLAQALAAMRPSAGSSAVIVLRAVNASDCAFPERRVAPYQDQKYLSAHRPCHQKSQ